MTETRIYERDTDTLFIKAFRSDPAFAAGFAHLAGFGNATEIPRVLGQTKHLTRSGSIDIDVTYPGGPRLLIENKIDAGYSMTRMGEGQPERYKATVAEYRKRGVAVWSVLLAPKVYLVATRSREMFDHPISYESLRRFLSGDDRYLLNAAIKQAETPYEPVENAMTGKFFEVYRNFVEQRFPALVMKRDPNAGGVRPTNSRAIYFDVGKTLSAHTGIPKPRMSLQCWDSGASSASVKIMIGKWGCFAGRLKAPESLTDIAAHLRPAGQSLGIVIDTPRLDTQASFNSQTDKVAEGLEAALRLQAWWRDNAATLRTWARQLVPLDMA